MKPMSIQSKLRENGTHIAKLRVTKQNPTDMELIQLAVRSVNEEYIASPIRLTISESDSEVHISVHKWDYPNPKDALQDALESQFGVVSRIEGDTLVVEKSDI